MPTPSKRPMITRPAVTAAVTVHTVERVGMQDSTIRCTRYKAQPQVRTQKLRGAGCGNCIGLR